MERCFEIVKRCFQIQVSPALGAIKSSVGLFLALVFTFHPLLNEIFSIGPSVGLSLNYVVLYPYRSVGGIFDLVWRLLLTILGSNCTLIGFMWTGIDFIHIIVFFIFNFIVAVLRTMAPWKRFESCVTASIISMILLVAIQGERNPRTGEIPMEVYANFATGQVIANLSSVSIVMMIGLIIFPHRAITTAKEQTLIIIEKLLINFDNFIKLKDSWSLDAEFQEHHLKDQMNTNTKTSMLEKNILQFRNPPELNILLEEIALTRSYVQRIQTSAETGGVEINNEIKLFVGTLDLETYQATLSSVLRILDRMSALCRWRQSNLVSSQLDFAKLQNESAEFQPLIQKLLRISRETLFLGLKLLMSKYSIHRSYHEFSKDHNYEQELYNKLDHLKRYQQRLELQIPVTVWKGLRTSNVTYNETLLLYFNVFRSQGVVKETQKLCEIILEIPIKAHSCCSICLDMGCNRDAKTMEKNSHRNGHLHCNIFPDLKSYFEKVRQQNRPSWKDILFGFKLSLALTLSSLPNFFPGSQPFFQRFINVWGLIQITVLLNPTIGETNLASIWKVVGTVVGALLGAVCFLIAEVSSDNEEIRIAVTSILVAVVNIPIYYLRYTLGVPHNITMLTVQLSVTGVVVTSWFEASPHRSSWLIMGEIVLQTVFAILVVLLCSVYLFPVKAKDELAFNLGKVLRDSSRLYFGIVRLLPPLQTRLVPNDQVEAEVASRISKLLPVCTDMLTNLRIELANCGRLLSASIAEPRIKFTFLKDELKPAFDPSSSERIIKSCTFIVDHLALAFLAVSEGGVVPDSVFLVFMDETFKRLRGTLTGQTALMYYTLASALENNHPLPPVLPDIAIARKYMYEKVQEQLAQIRSPEILMEIIEKKRAEQKVKEGFMENKSDKGDSVQIKGDDFAQERSRVTKFGTVDSTIVQVTSSEHLECDIEEKDRSLDFLWWSGFCFGISDAEMELVNLKNIVADLVGVDSFMMQYFQGFGPTEEMIGLLMDKDSNLKDESKS